MIAAEAMDPDRLVGRSLASTARQIMTQFFAVGTFSGEDVLVGTDFVWHRGNKCNSKGVAVIT